MTEKLGTDGVLTQEAGEQAVTQYFADDFTRQHYVESRGHWEDIIPAIARAERDALLELFTEWIIADVAIVSHDLALTLADRIAELRAKQEAKG